MLSQVPIGLDVMLLDFQFAFGICLFQYPTSPNLSKVGFLYKLTFIVFFSEFPVIPIY